MENHSVVGGIGSATAEALAEAGIGKPLVRLGVPGCYAHGASRPYLMAEYGIDARALVRAVEKLLDKKLDSDEGFELEAKEQEKSALPVEERPEDL